jgi:hypothetical protein
MIIKLILISLAGAFAVLVLRQRASGGGQALVRLGGIGVAVLAVVAVLFPDTTVWAAHIVGVARGTDLVLYVFVMTFMITTLVLFQRLHHLEERVILLNRELALRESSAAEKCGE